MEELGVPAVGISEGTWKRFLAGKHPINANAFKAYCQVLGFILASASTDSTVRLWNVNTGKCFQILQGHTDWAYTVAFHPKGEAIATGSADCTIKLWDWHTGQ